MADHPERHVQLGSDHQCHQRRPTASSWLMQVVRGLLSQVTQKVDHRVSQQIADDLERTCHLDYIGWGQALWQRQQACFLSGAHAHRHSMILRKQGLQVLLSQRQRYSMDGDAEAEILVLLAALSRQLGDSGDALALAQQAIVRCPHMVVSSHLLEESLELAYADLGEHTKRKDLLERALKINKARHGEHHSIVASTMDDLGWVYGSLGFPQMQRDFQELALKIKEAHYGRGHFELAITLNNLAVAYLGLGENTRERGSAGGSFGDPGGTLRVGSTSRLQSLCITSP